MSRVSRHISFHMSLIVAALTSAAPAWSECPLNSIAAGCYGFTSSSPTESIGGSCGDPSATSFASYNVPAGTLEGSANVALQPGQNCGNAAANVATIDDYVVLGGLPFGTPITIRALLTLGVNSTNCFFASGRATIQEGDANSASGGACLDEVPLEIVIHSFVGTPIRISCFLEVEASTCSEGGVGAEASAQLTFLDLPPGTTLTSCQGYMQSTLVTAVGDGSQPRLDLESVGSNPSHGTLTLAATLPTEGPARIALFDVHGRLVASVNLDGTGRHLVPFGAERQLAAGVYFARLTQGRHSVGRRQVILR